MANRFCLTTTSPAETADAARNLGACLTAGDVVLLSGGIGAGKTHFARALIQDLLLQIEDVPSPTFTLVQEYTTQKGALWHSDLYRLSDVDDIIELGLETAFESAICLIEWPDRLGDLTPQDALNIRFVTQERGDSRILECQWTDPKWDKIPAVLAL